VKARWCAGFTLDRASQCREVACETGWQPVHAGYLTETDSNPQAGSLFHVLLLP